MSPSISPIDIQIDILHQISKIVSSGLSLDEMLKALIRLAAQVTTSDACLVYLVEPTGEIVLRASQLPHAREIGSIRMHAGEGVTGWVAAHKSVVALSANASADKRFKNFPGLVEDTFEAFLSVPLVSGGHVIGVINVHHKKPHAHTPEQVALLSFMGEQMGGAIARSRVMNENARLLEESLEIKRQLEARKLIERAKGILQSKYNLTEEDAYLRLRGESRRLRRPMRDLAEAIILAQDVIGSRPDALLPLEGFGADGLRPEA
ncbi:MAG TPA: GAF domain-containing protein [Bryobacteraceae bacterium]|jgi:uroporphyrinogen-III synthase|nr:GAF domain-containing protein [Bryobacteraceae bacterium]